LVKGKFYRSLKSVEKKMLFFFLTDGGIIYEVAVETGFCYLGALNRGELEIARL
jgi:hypothetical protein